MQRMHAHRRPKDSAQCLELAAVSSVSQYQEANGLPWKAEEFTLEAKESALEPADEVQAKEKTAAPQEKQVDLPPLSLLCTIQATNCARVGLPRPINRVSLTALAAISQPLQPCWALNYFPSPLVQFLSPTHL